MKTFKQIDFYIQVMLAAISVCTMLLSNTVSYTIYIIQALWQAASLITHAIKQQFHFSHKERKRYLFFCLCFIAILTSLRFFKADALALRIINYSCPPIFFYYLHLCYREIFIYMKRPLSVLK